MTGKVTDVLGVHIGGSLKVLSSLDSLVSDLGVRYFQVFLHSPMTLFFRVKSGQEKTFSLLKEYSRFKRVNFVAHGSYLINLSNGAFLGKISVNNLKQSLYVCRELGIRYFVTHVGFRKETSFEEAFDNLKNNVIEVVSSCPEVIFCLETGSGAKASKDADMGNLEILISLISHLRAEGVKNVGLCYDTQHVFADGYRIYGDEDGFSPQIKSLIEVFHLNGNEGTKFGGHLDRHSYSSLNSSSNFSLPFSDMKDMTDFCIQKGVPIILERRSLDLLKEDITFLKQIYGEDL